MLTLDVAFAGSPEEQKLASDIFDAMRGHGRFMASDEPIRVAIESLAAFLSRDGATVDETTIRAAAGANASVFAVEEPDEGSALLVTTKNGRVPGQRRPDGRHSFAKRFMTPLPKPEVPVMPRLARPRVDGGWAGLPAYIETDGLTEELDLPAEVVVETPLEVAELSDAVAPLEVAPPAEIAQSVDEPIVEEPAPPRVVRVPSVPATATLTDVDDLALASAIGDRLRTDPRIANFGDQWMIEERVPRFSRGDLRRLREYIQEQEQPLTDEVLVLDVLNGRQGTPEFDALRFAVNFRLSKEHREFEFVGTPNQRFWSTSSLPQIGTTRRKPNEIGSDYRFLLDETAPAGSERRLPSVDHVLTFYEYHLGLLPYDEHMRSLLPAPVLPNQRSAVLTFECPQSYTTYLVELRYPTPNRGGFILGLDDFYNENLVPGALITIDRSDNDGHYLVRYIQEPSRSARLLELEDRRQRYVFRPTTYACGVMDDYLLTEERFPSLGSEKPLEEKVRRRPESVVSASFERLGHKSDGPGFVASFDELLAAVNIERPFSERYLRSILDNDESGAFARDPDGNDAYTYVPGTSS